MNTGTFGTAINCMDGRTQLPVIEWMKREYGIDYVDTITEPGPAKLLARCSDEEALASIKRRLEISVTKHGSRRVALVAHADCAGNPVDKDTQLHHLRLAAATLLTWGLPFQLDLLWLGDDFQVTRIGWPASARTRVQPGPAAEPGPVRGGRRSRL
jgi:hypothetical protein